MSLHLMMMWQFYALNKLSMHLSSKEAVLSVRASIIGTNKDIDLDVQTYYMTAHEQKLAA